MVRLVHHERRRQVFLAPNPIILSLSKGSL